MKKTQGFTMSNRRFLIALGLLMLLTSGDAFAAIRTWNGGGGNDNWNTADNWGGTAPVAGDTLIFAGSNRLTPTNDFVVGTAFGGLQFDAGAGAFTISGTTIRFTFNIVFIGNPAAPVTHTFNQGFLLTANRMITTEANGNITILGAITDGGGKRALTKAGSGTLTLNGANTFTGQMRIDCGILNANTIFTTTTSSSLGRGTDSSIIRIGNAATSGSLVFTGTSSVGATDRQVQIGNGTTSGDTGGATIANNKASVTDTLTISSNTFNSAHATATAARTLTLGGSNTGLNTISGAIVDNAAAAKINLAKADAGTWVLAGANAYTGPTAINNGTLLVNGSHAAAGAYMVAATATLGGSGVINSAVTISNNGTLAPGANNAAAGTLTTAGLTFQSTAVSKFDLNTATTVGAGVNDLVAVNGDLAAGGTIQINVLSALSTNGTYRLFNYTGALSGSFAITVPNTSYVATLDTATPGQVNVSFSLPALTLTWKGSEALYNWDLNTSANWTNGTAMSVFMNDLAVVFDGTAATNVANLVGTLLPLSVTVNSSADVSLQGSGTLSGNMALTKSGSGTLSIATANDYSGSTTVSNGTLTLNAPATGSTLSSPLVTVKAAATLVLAGAGSPLGDTTDVALEAGGLLDVRTSDTLGGLSGAGVVRLTSASPCTLKVNSGNESTVFSGKLENTGGGALGLTKAGSGSLTLSGTNTYNGATVVSGGTLILTQAKALSTNTALSVAAGALIDLNFTGTVTLKSLTINGVLLLPNTLYSSADLPEFLSGSGFLMASEGRIELPSPSSGRWVLRSGKKADKWQDAFVTGNGTHGTMVMGESLNERIINVHEELFLHAWDRSIVGVPVLSQYLAEQRRLIGIGSNNAAFFVCGDASRQVNAVGAGATWELTPHPAFDLRIGHLNPGGLLSYTNELDLETGEARCQWQRANAAVDQRVFSSRSNNVNVVSLKAAAGSKLNLTLALSETPGRSGMFMDTFDLDNAFSSVTTNSEPGWLSYKANYTVDKGGYEGLARVTLIGGGMVKTGAGLTITNASEVLVLIRITPLEVATTNKETEVKALLTAMPTDYGQLLQPHALKHREMLGRVTLDLGASNAWKTATTQEMLQDVAANGPSAHYLEAAHVMGRYLLISSCGKYPPPLRGIWGGDWKADWSGGFVLDSNLDLAMSAAGPGNLPECIESYAGYIERQLPGWRTNAFNTFGTRGFMAASFANPETGYQTHKNPVHWYYICQAGWTLRPLYDYALLSKNDTFMQNRVLPLYREMADFYADYMVFTNGNYHILPGCSPENNTPPPYDGQMADDCTVDLAVAREVYQVLIEQGPKFGIPPAQISAWENIRTNITPYRIDANGALAEWAPAKYTVVNYGSRHSSHLYPIFPGFEFFQSGSSPQLLEAARVALRKPIEVEHLQLYDELSGHGIMYAALMSARMRETMNVNKLLNHISMNGFRYDSMVSSHAPNGRYYILDVALSFPRLLMEMLVFSHPGNIDLMPGWNAELPAGSCTGLLVRGGHIINIAWAGGAMTSAVLHAGANETLTVRFGAQSASLTVQSGQQYELKNLFPGTLPLPSVLTIGLTNPSGNGSSTSETIDKSVDSNTGTKWCTSHGGKPVIWQMSYATPPAQALRGYSLTSANDVPGRDPIRWTLEGSQDGSNWTVLDSRDLGASFASRYLKKNFGTGNTVSYRNYRFVFQPSSTETMFQVAEIALDFSGANYATGHVPANLATGISQSPTLSWVAGSGATRHDVYFGTSQSAVQNATTASPEYKGRRSSASYATNGLSQGTVYYWRVDETTASGTPLYNGYALGFTTAGVVPPVVPARTLPELAGKSVALWSKFTGRFVRSPGGAGGTLLADRDAYDANGGEGRFLCAAESGGTVAFMDLLLQQYVTVVSGPLVSMPAGTAEMRRFTLEDQGNAYCAIRAANGWYVRAGVTGELVADAALLTDEALFTIVPIRDGPNVVMRAYNGDDPDNQIPDTIPNEVALFCDNPADFPVNKVNIGTLQMTAGLSSDQQLLEMRQVWNNKNFEDESIIPYSVTTPLTNQLDGIARQIKRIESLGYTYDYIILYHEILADLPGGPWSDPRISSLEEVSLLRERLLDAYNRGELKHPSYKIFCMPYQFQPSLMGIAPYENTPVGCDTATLAFIKQNFDGLFLEVNGHDYLSRNEHVDAARAAAWCRTNGLEFGITSGLAASKDAVYKSMYQNIFAQMDAVGFDKSWSGMHYILHHVYQQYPDRLPEWVSNTTTENARWLIEQVMPPEAWSLSARDTDGDGTSDGDEIRAGTFPFGPGGLLVRPEALAYDDVYGYTDGALSGQAGAPVGFNGVWTSSGAFIDADARTMLQTNGSYRSSRSFSPAPLTNAGTIQVRATLALAANANYSGLELATTAGSDAGSVRLASHNAQLQVSVVGTGGTNSPVLLANDGQTHQWLLELNLATRAGRVWLDADPSSSPGAAFTLPTGFQLNALNLATFALGQPGTPSLLLQEILILPGAVSTYAGLFEALPSVYGQEGIVNGNDNATLADFNRDGALDFSTDAFLYRNDGGATFAFARDFGAPCVWGDYDNDGLLDQFVWAGGGSLLRPENLAGTSVTTFHNDAMMPLLPSLTANGACWGDWNNDGSVDLYVTGYEVSKALNGGFPDAILMSHGGTQFVSSVLMTTTNNRARGVAACDFDQDNDLDIYVSNSRQRANILWLNNGSGSFTDVAAARGVAGDGASANDRGDTIGSCWGDFNNDGLFDLFVANSATADLAQDRSMLLQNMGTSGGYTFVKRWTLDNAQYQESYATAMAADYDNDGDLDLFVTTANGGDRSRLFRNDGGWAFTDVTETEGLPSDLGQTTAAAWGDVNNDGFMDLLTNNRLFLNRTNSNTWLKFSLAGNGTNINRAAIGARVRIDLGGGNILVRQVEGGSGKGSQNDLTLHFGLGGRTATVNVEIIWPGGAVQTLTAVTLGQTVVVADPEPAPGMTISPATLTPVCQQSENAPTQQFTVQSSSRLPTEFTLSDDASWLLTPASGAALRGEPTPVQVAYDTSLLAPGIYTATITITSGAVTNSPQTVSVTLTVATVMTWTGAGGDDNWTTGPNWGGVAPGQYDSLIFAGSTRTSNTNNLAADISLGNLSFAAAASAFTLAGNRLTLLGNIGFLGEPATAVTQTINLDMILSADSMVTAPSNGVIAIGGVLSGAHKLTKAGAGALTLSGANSHSGGTEFGTGTLNINNASALGSGLFTLAGGTLNNSTAAALTNAQNNAIAWNANVIFLGTQSLDLGTGNVTLSAARTVTVNANTLTLGGALGDGGNNYGLTKDGVGALTLNGPSTYTGTTAVKAGTLNAATLADSTASSLGLGSLMWLGYRTTTGTLNYTGAGDTTARTLQMGYGNQSTYRGGATLNANGANGGSGLVFAAPNFTVIQGNTGSAAYRLLTLGGSNMDANQIVGVIADVNPGVTQTRLTKADAGCWTLAGTNTYTGITTVSGGTLLVNGAHAAPGAGAYTVFTNATLGGRGTIGSAVTINNGGTLAPGGTNAAARLTCNGNLTLAANARFHVNINGPAVESQYDQLAMAGNTLNITGATLDVEVGPGFAPRSRIAFEIASGFANLIGTFAGLPEGAEFQPEGAPVSFYVHYDAASNPQKIWLRTRNLKDGTILLLR